MQVAGDCNCPASFSKSVQCCFFVYRDISWWKPAAISCLIDPNGYSSKESTSGDVCPKTSPGSYMEHMLTIKSWYKVTITIHNEVTVKTRIWLFTYWWNIPTLTDKTQLASMWSTSCNIQHLAQQRSQHKIQGSMLRKSTINYFGWANMANSQSDPGDNITKWIKARAAWKQKGSDRWEHCVAYDQKRSFRWRQDEICTF